MRALLHTVLLLVALPLAGWAQSVEDQIVSQLRAQGFEKIEVSRSLLGRTVLRATSDQFDREMVFNPATGEILRDLVTRRLSSDDRPAVIVPDVRGRDDEDDREDRSSSSSRRGSGSGSGSDDDRDDADDEIDRDDDDRDERHGDDDRDDDRADDDDDNDDNDDNDDDDEDEEDDEDDDED